MILNLLDNPDLELLQKLEWPFILHDMGRVLHFQSSQEKILAPLTSQDISQIERHFDNLDYIIHKVEQGESDSLYNAITSLPAETSFGELPQRLQKGSILDIAELNALCKMIEHFKDLAKHKASSWPHLVKCLEESAPSLQLLNTLFQKHVSKFRQFVSSDGVLDYERHPELGPLWIKLRKLEQEIRAFLQEISRLPEYSSALQIEGYDIRNDRFVIAIRTDAYKSDLGLIIDRSDSGMTLYVEPFPIRERCNERLRLLAKIDEIITRFCQDFCQNLAPFAPMLEQIKDIFLELDITLAKARYSLEKNLIRPKLSIVPELSVRGLFHPLIPNPISNNLELDSAQKGLIISGPNTGGKTALLKTLCLTHLFLHFGLFVPATSATLHPYRGIFYFGNDEQNLTEGLSSFAAEASNYLHLLANMSESNLILIDEIFNSTSSEEASALAMGLLDEIKLISTSHVILSTHHQMLKTLMHAQKNYLSAHVGFDPDTHRPTYKLHLGTPGASMALSIFENLSTRYECSHSIIEKAQNVLDQKTISYEHLLQEVSLKEAQLSKQLEANRRLEHDLRNQKKANEGILHLKMQQSLKEYEDELSDHIRKAQNVLDEIQRDRDNLSLKQMGKKLVSIQSDFQLEKNKILPSTQNQIDLNIAQNLGEEPDTLEIGKTYFHKGSAKKVVIKSFNASTNDVVALIGTLSIRCKKSDLKEFKTGAYTSSKKSAPRVNVNVFSERSAKIDIDCRGMRLEEFQTAVEQAITDLVSGQIPFATIIHGHGDGILKKWLRSYIKNQKGVRCELPEDGNDGATKLVAD